MTKRSQLPNYDYRLREQISRHGLAQRIYEYGWHVIGPEVDNGQDLQIEVLRREKKISAFDSTGCIFHVQLKATDDVLNHAAKRRQFYEYKVSIGNLLNWDYFPIPVVFILWDVKQAEGRWVIIKDAISDLDTRRPRWRIRGRKHEVKIRIPWTQSTDDNGLDELSRQLGNIFVPQALVTKGELPGGKVKFEIPSSDNEMFEMVKQHIAKGTPLHLKKPYITEFRLPDLVHDFFWVDGLSITDLYIKQHPSEDYLLRASLEVITNNQKTARFPYLEFKKILMGQEVHTISNEHQGRSICFTIELPSPQVAEQLHRADKSIGLDLKFTFRAIGADVLETKDNLTLLELREHGGVMNLILHDHDDLEISMPQESTTSSLPFEPLPQQFVDFIDNLCEIQKITKVRLRLPADDSEISGEQYEYAHFVAELLHRGEVNVKMNNHIFLLSLIPEHIAAFIQDGLALVQDKQPLSFELNRYEEEILLLGKKIDIGQVRAIIRGYFAEDPEAFAHLTQSHDYSQDLPLLLDDATLTFQLVKS